MIIVGEGCWLFRVSAVRGLKFQACKQTRTFYVCDCEFAFHINVEVDSKNIFLCVYGP